MRKAGQAISGSPAALLAGSNELETNFTLSEAGEADGMNWVEAVPKAADSGFEKVRLGFAGKDLKAMELHDSFGQTTHIRFGNLERNPALPAASFKFTPPAGVDIGRLAGRVGGAAFRHGIITQDQASGSAESLLLVGWLQR